MKYIKKIFSFGKIALKEFIISNSLTNAAALAYTTLLSLVPLMVVSLGLFSAFPAFKKYAHMFHEYIFDHLVPSSAKNRQHYIESFAAHSTLSSTQIQFIYK